MQVYMLGLFFSLLLSIDQKKQGTLYFSGTKVFEFFSGKLFASSTFGKFFKRIAKIAKYLKAVEIKIFNLSFSKKTSYLNINSMKVGTFCNAVQLISSSYGVITIMCHYGFYNDRSNSSKNGTISDDENTLVQLTQGVLSGKPFLLEVSDKIL